MIVFDTNVASELMKPSPDGTVWNWVVKQPRDRLCTTAVTVAEIRWGIARMPIGRRRSLLQEAAEDVFGWFDGKILPFGAAAAGAYPQVMLGRVRSGLPIEAYDAQIAAICRAEKAVLVTRNLEDFAETGIELINPWE
jgi:predicted nucleic acid-binding protein